MRMMSSIGSQLNLLKCPISLEVVCFIKRLAFWHKTVLQETCVILQIPGLCAQVKVKNDIGLFKCCLPWSHTGSSLGNLSNLFLLVCQKIKILLFCPVSKRCKILHHEAEMSLKQLQKLL